MSDLTPNPSYSLSIQVKLPDQPGMFAKVIQAIATAGGSMGHIELRQRTHQHLIREIHVDAAGTEHAEAIVAAVKAIKEIKILEVFDRTFDLHRGGKITIQSKLALNGPEDLAMAYTPGVGRICKAIAEDIEQVHHLTMKSNTVAVVTDGSAVLGLGNIGPEAALPVMEGKAMLFKEFAQLNAFPICLATQDVDEIVATVKHLEPIFGGINLEDISAPRCFEVEERLKRELSIPVFHDDQHGTAIVVLAALFNALKLVHKPIEQVKVVINGAGAAGIAIANLLRKAGVETLCLCDSRGIVSQDRTDLNPAKQALVWPQSGSLADALKGADVFLGVSVPGAVTPEMVRTMAADAIVFAMANPIPEIQPESIHADVAVMATGRSDYPNQINNVLAFPGVFRGALNCCATSITTDMHLQAAHAIAALVNHNELHRDHIVPSVFDPRVAPAVASAVEQSARCEGVAH